MTKADFVNNVAKRSGFSLEDAKKLLTAFEDEVKELGKNGDSLTLPGFLTFKSHVNVGRQRRNPKTGETFMSPDKKILKVKAGKALADHVAGY